MRSKKSTALRIASAGLLAASCIAFPASMSSAATTSTQPTTSGAVTASASASSCLQGLSGPYDVVYSYQGLTLKCGAGVTGITHIAAGHDIDEGGADDVDIVECMARVISYGDTTAPGEGNKALKWDYSGPGYAVIAWDSSSKDVVTLYDSGDNWARCGG